MLRAAGAPRRGVRQRPGEPGRGVSAGQSQEVPQNGVAVFGQHRLGVELDAFDDGRPVPHAYDDPVLGAGRHFERCGQLARIDDEGMVARAGDRSRQARKNGTAVVVDAGGLAVHGGAAADHQSSAGRADALMPQADAEDRDASRQRFDKRRADAGLRGRARARRDDDRFRRQRAHVVHRDGVVAADVRNLAQFAQILHEVVGERVVVVDHQDHRDLSRYGPARRAALMPAAAYNPRRAISSARIRTLALLTVSSYSAAGSESATIPPPAWTYATPSRSVTVRIAMHVSSAPPKPA